MKTKIKKTKTKQFSYEEKFLNRSLPFLTKEGIEKLGKSKIAVAGCGGVGGAMAILLARLGVGNFTLADPGIFDEPDINRQWGANLDTLGRNKTDVYSEILQSINPNIQVTKFRDGLNYDNVEAFNKGTNFVLDCLDIGVDIKIRKKVFDQARKQNAYSMTAPILAFGGVMAIATPSGMPMDLVVDNVNQGASGKLPNGLKEIFMPEHIDIIESKISTQKIPSLALAPSLMASIACTEALLALLGRILKSSRKPLVLPKMLFVDTFRLSYFIGDIRKLL